MNNSTDKQHSDSSRKIIMKDINSGPGGARRNEKNSEEKPGSRNKTDMKPLSWGNTTSPAMRRRGTIHFSVYCELHARKFRDERGKTRCMLLRDGTPRDGTFRARETKRRKEGQTEGRKEGRTRYIYARKEYRRELDKKKQEEEEERGFKLDINGTKVRLLLRLVAGSYRALSRERYNSPVNSATNMGKTKRLMIVINERVEQSSSGRYRYKLHGNNPLLRNGIRVN